VSDKSLRAALEKLAKWRKFFASWQVGTVPAGDGRYKAVADHWELSILMRAELSALTGLLLRKGVFTEQEHRDALELEARQLDHDYEESYPGWRSLPEGLHMRMPEAGETMRKLGFPP
jgi:hypothetical protein